MSTGRDMRGTGRTTEQMRAAPIGAFFVWVNDRLEYPKDLSRSIGRTDLQIIRPSKLERHESFAGVRAPAVILDHACQLTDRQWDGWQRACELLRNYEMSDDYWVDVTQIGSEWNIEYNTHTGAWRHRPIRQDCHVRNIFGERGVGEWIAGRPPVRDAAT